ncbi:hypothetical protein RIF29_24006 [Crotalaria pallida]|uniref:caffeate O-methyltransferase n=1 Tax=Crotalaria pallida TaxID=3830 RepID=A0AAN9HYH3_CROPI
MAPSSSKSFAPQENEEALTFGLEVLGSLTFPIALLSTINLGVFEIIAKAGEGAKLSAKVIAIEIGTNNKEAPLMLDRLLRMMVSHSVLNCSVHEDTQTILYSLSPKSKYFVNDADGVSLGPVMALPLDKVFSQSWTELNGAIKEGGIPFERVYGMHAFEYASKDPKFNEIFNKAMINFTTLVMKKILEIYKGFEHINRLVDVGGGLGVNLKLITSKYPNVKGVNFDLPHVIENAPVFPGVEHVAGDMFESVPKGDAIFMKWILHDWSDEHCSKLLKNCYKAIPDDGKLIVVDMILPTVPEATPSAKFGYGSDLIMLTQNPGGRERNQQEFMELATSSGFSGIKLVCCVSGLWVIEFFK